MQPKDWKKERNEILGLGDNSSKKSYFPELKKKISDLEIHKDLLDQLSNLVFIASVEDGSINYTNQAAKLLLLQMQNKPKDIHHVFPGISDIQEELITGIEHTFSEILFIGEQATPFEVRIRQKELADNNLLYIIGQDISEKMVFENELLRAKNSFETIFNSTYDSIFIHDENGKIIDVNDSMVAKYGMQDKHDALQYTIAEYSSPSNDFEALVPIWGDVLNGNNALIEWKAMSPVSGKEFDVEVSLRSSDFLHAKLVVAVVRDVSQRKEIERIRKENHIRLEEQNREYLSLNEELKERNREIQEINQQLAKAKEMAEESDRLKSAFLANMSHEIRTPLNAIIGFSQLMAEHQSDQNAQERYSQIIQQRGNDLIRIISDILDISKIEADRIEIFNESISLCELIDDIEFTYTENPYAAAKFKNVKLEFQIEEKLQGKQFIADSSRLKQVLINLIDNAIKFTDKGHIRLYVKYEEPKKLHFSVEDTGCGIEQEMLPKIFKEFRQAFNKSEKQHTGTGLGLSISKALIDLMNGQISVDSELEKGSTFYFTLPFIETT